MDYQQGQPQMLRPPQRMVGGPNAPLGVPPQQQQPGQFVPMRKPGQPQPYPGGGVPGGQYVHNQARYTGDQHYAPNNAGPNQMRYMQQPQQHNPQYQEMDPQYGSSMGNMMSVGGGAGAEMDPAGMYLSPVMSHGVPMHAQQPPAQQRPQGGYQEAPMAHVSPSKPYPAAAAAAQGAVPPSAGQMAPQQNGLAPPPQPQRMPLVNKDLLAYQYNFGFDPSSNFAVYFGGCPHWAEHRNMNPQWEDVVRTIVQYGLSVRQKTSKQPSYPFPWCTGCNTSSNRLEACLHCVYLGCWSGKGSHMLQHFQRMNYVHHFSMDISRFTVYCARCQDYLYDRELEAIAREEIIAAREVQIQASAPNPSRARCRDWKPLDMELKLIEGNSRPVASYGLRGLYNLGSTCFMNSILQSLVHNPLVRSYFLSDQHNRKDCVRQRDTPRPGCLCCDLDLLISKAFSGETEPFSPHQLLYSVWTHSQELAGYEQQDAHEFFISLLNGVHLHAGGTPDNCECIMHETFQGMLKSDVTCLKCSHVSTTHDPFVDISLDLSEASLSSQNDFESLLGEPSKSKLSDCLKRFTSPEKLDNQDFRCETCGNAGSLKQFSFKVTPCVLSIHLKRFEHSQTASNKIDTFVEFPTKLDLSPYLSSSLNADTDNFLMEQTEPKINHDYELFAVVNHVGTLETGHYISYVKSKGEWFRIDDAMITRSSTQEVLKCKAYMLYYVKAHLDYQMDINPILQA